MKSAALTSSLCLAFILAGVQVGLPAIGNEKEPGHHMPPGYTIPEHQRQISFITNPVCQDNIVYAPGESQIYLINAESGAEIAHKEMQTPMGNAPRKAVGTTLFTHPHPMLVASDITTGKVRWKFDPGKSPSISAFSITANRVYGTALEGKLYVLERESGKLLDTITLPIAGSVGPVADDADNIYAAVASSPQGFFLFALNKKTHETIWKAEVKYRYISWCAAGGKVVLCGNGDNAYAFDTRTGKQVWQLADVATAAKVSDSTAFIGMQGSMVAINLNDAGGQDNPKFIWQTPSTGSPTERIDDPVLADDGLLVFTSLWRYVYALDSKSGKLRWSYRAKESIQQPACVQGGRVFIVCDNGKLFALDARSGKQLWQFTTGTVTEPAQHWAD